MIYMGVPSQSRGRAIHSNLFSKAKKGFALLSLTQEAKKIEGEYLIQDTDKKIIL